MPRIRVPTIIVIDANKTEGMYNLTLYKGKKSMSECTIPLNQWDESVKEVQDWVDGFL